MKKSASKIYRKLITTHDPYKAFRMIEDMDPEKAKNVLQLIVRNQQAQSNQPKQLS